MEMYNLETIYLRTIPHFSTAVRLHVVQMRNGHRSYLFPHVFALIWWKIRGRSHKLQSKQPKTRENLVFYFACLGRGLKPVLSVPWHLSYHTSPWPLFFQILLMDENWINFQPTALHRKYESNRLYLLI